MTKLSDAMEDARGAWKNPWLAVVVVVLIFAYIIVNAWLNGYFSKKGEMVANPERRSEGSVKPPAEEPIAHPAEDFSTKPELRIAIDEWMGINGTINETHALQVFRRLATEGDPIAAGWIVLVTAYSMHFLSKSIEDFQPLFAQDVQRIRDLRDELTSYVNHGNPDAATAAQVLAYHLPIIRGQVFTQDELSSVSQTANKPDLLNPMGLAMLGHHEATRNPIKSRNLEAARAKLLESQQLGNRRAYLLRVLAEEANPVRDLRAWCERMKAICDEGIKVDDVACMLKKVEIIDNHGCEDNEESRRKENREEVRRLLTRAASLGSSLAKHKLEWAEKEWKREDK